jgi:hypothetical protein
MITTERMLQETLDMIKSGIPAVHICGEDAQPKKPPLYKRIGEKLKGRTHPIADALETLKQPGKLPPFMRDIDHDTLGDVPIARTPAPPGAQ